MCTMCIEVLVLRTALQNKRGQSETRMHLQSLEQKMLSKKIWLAFFHNIKNKYHLLNLFVTYLCDDGFVKSCCQYWLTTKMKYSKSQVVSQRFLNATTMKTILE